MRLISFDVFDTLLIRRRAAPHDVFASSGMRLREAGIIADRAAFAHRRIEAERRARSQVPHGEVTLSAIYRELAAVYQWSDAAAQEAKTIEINVETAELQPVGWMLPEVRAARKRAGRVLFISDMYLPAGVIQDWLRRAGFWETGDLLYVSSEAGLTKGGTGALFGRIRKDLGVEFQNWTHHGDHAQADILLPRRLGIDAQPRTAAQLTARERSLRGTNRLAPGWRSLLAGAARLARLDQPVETSGDPVLRSFWETGADVAGPLFHAFVEWVLAEAERRNIGDLFFLSRDAWIFLRIAAEIQSTRPRPVRLHYLHVSRLALAGVDPLDPLSDWRMLAAPPVAFHSAAHAFANLGVDETNMMAPSWLPRSEWKRNLAPAERATLADWLGDSTRRPTIERALAGRALRARNYLRQEIGKAGPRCGLVDTGWRGTSQRAIAAALADGGATPVLTGFYLGLNSRVLDENKVGYFNSFCPLPLRRVVTHCVLLEIMTKADHGQVLDYAPAADNRSAPVLDDAMATPERSPLFHEGIMAFARRAISLGPELNSAPMAEVAAVVIGGFRAFVDAPSRSEAEVFGKLPHSDQLREQHRAALCPTLTTGQVLIAMIDWRRRPPGWWLAGQARFGHAPLIRLYICARKVKWLLFSMFGRLGESA
ncbi:MAG: hypothetical protein JWM88_397 [Verrucomicrobia bacterium]|nr:hypothetical protein [Verrucomicrobiota bacterium]